MIETPGHHPMRPRDWFEVGVRLLGVWTLITVFGDIRTILLIRMDLFTPERTPFATYIIRAATDAAVGFYLLFAAGHLVSLVFGHETRGCDVADSAQDPPK
jgi:hypothetical protein